MHSRVYCSEYLTYYSCRRSKLDNTKLCPEILYYLYKVQWCRAIVGIKSPPSHCRFVVIFVFISNIIFTFVHHYIACTRGDQKVRGKVLLNHIAFIDCNENSQI